MKTLLLATILFFAAMTFAGGAVVKDSLTAPTPTGTATPSRATPRDGLTTPTVVRNSRIANDNTNPTLRACDYWFAQWGRKRAKGTEADPFPANKQIGGKVNCRVWGEEVNRVVNGR